MKFKIILFLILTMGFTGLCFAVGAGTTAITASNGVGEIPTGTTTGVNGVTGVNGTSVAGTNGITGDTGVNGTGVVGTENNGITGNNNQITNSTVQ